MDKVAVRHIETRVGVERFLTTTRTKLLDGSYRPRLVRRVMIPKRGKLQLLEPIFEAEFLPVSYGFRPKRVS